ncbi:zinc transporter ZupT [Planctomycetes bacterium CA13]|uniref:Zinc transporter ZupT n=1 Tax=Novipirellula herctigrandis TaxID=2527986 RepID=A0A5C5Z4D9_9BACT|nr:zinc transporter ZupT [Planctomycetes bacterium CA13]
MTESLLAIYCVLIVLASVTGGWLPAIMRMTHLRTQMLMSFVAGLMLGIAMLHMLPHASELLGSPFRTSAAALAGILAMFLLMRAFHAHAHGGQEEACEQDHSHDHKHSHDHGHSHESAKHLGWLGMLFGLGLHTLMDGVALAASIAAEAPHQPWLGLAGLGTFLAVMLHKPLDAFAITSVMKSGGWTPVQQSLVNMSFSLACPIGALLFFFGASQMSAESEFLGWGLAVSAGFFICISLSDLLPEVAFHDHDRLKLTSALLLGVALAVGIENLPGHAHDDHSQEGPAPIVQAVESP